MWPEGVAEGVAEGVVWGVGGSARSQNWRGVWVSLVVSDRGFGQKVLRKV